MTTGSLPPAMMAARQNSIRNVGRLLRSLQLACDHIAHFRTIVEMFERRKSDLRERHPEFASADLRMVAVCWLVILVPLGVWLIDIILLSGVAEYLASLVFPARPAVILPARLLVAFAVVMIELTLSSRIHSAYLEAVRSENRTGLHDSPGWVHFFGRSSSRLASQLRSWREERSKRSAQEF